MAALLVPIMEDTVPCGQDVPEYASLLILGFGLGMGSLFVAGRAAAHPMKEIIGKSFILV